MTACTAPLTCLYLRLILAKCTYEVSAGEKKITGQTTLSREVILCYDETKKMHNLFADTQCLVEEQNLEAAVAAAATGGVSAVAALAQRQR